MGPGDQRRVSVEIREHDQEHEIVVSDNGRGIAREDHERIFKVFQTCGPSRNAGHHSSGIGLAIVKKIAEAYGGRAWVESTPGEGARFHIALPAD
jgi:signal transduction histidine kinase